MPSIPQSLLWISLVVLWLFVLVPMLINKRDTVRRTSDLALSTRVLNGAGRSRLRRRGGPASGHRHDPDWQAENSDLDADLDAGLDAGLDADLDEDDTAHIQAYRDVEDYDEAVREAQMRDQSMMMVVAPASEATTEPVYIDVDVVDESSGALPVGDVVQESLFEQPPAGQTTDHAAGEPSGDIAADPADPADDEYEYVEDSSGLEAGDEPAPAVTPRSARRRMESTTAAAVSARKYRFRKRVLLAMAAIMVATAVSAFTVSADMWWACLAAAVVTLIYLAYLRRQTRIEEQIRRRRQQRMARSRYAGEAFGGRAAEADVDVAAARLHRPGAAVLDIDDEDPIFEHLDEMPYSRRYDLPRAAGQ